MKKIFLLLFAGLFLLTGCDIHKTYETYEVISGVDLKTIYCDVKADRWDIVDDVDEGCYLYQVLDFPEITSNVISDGAVLVYLIDESGRDNVLPYVFPLDNGVMKNIRYDVSEGHLTIIMEWSDPSFIVESSCKIKVCIFYNMNKKK